MGSACAAFRGAEGNGRPELKDTPPKVGSQAVSVRFMGLEERLALSEASVSDLTSSDCCLIKSWSVSNLAACFWVAVSRKCLVALTVLFNSARGPSILLITLSMS